MPRNGSAPLCRDLAPLISRQQIGFGDPVRPSGLGVYERPAERGVPVSDDDILTKQDNPALMTVEEAASYLRLAPWTLRHWVCQKKIPYVRLGRAVRFRRKDMERFVSQNIHGRSEDRESTGLAQGRSATAGYQEA
jgi:excisionase family DNA binding protein